MNDITIMIEKTRMPIGSRRRLPTGNFFLSFDKRQPTSLLVVQMMIVHRRSRAESTSDAMSERELDQMAATPFAAKRKMFTRTFIWRMSELLLNLHNIKTYINRPPHMFCRCSSFLALVFGKKWLQILST
jgi:hypothetical protein